MIDRTDSVSDPVGQDAPRTLRHSDALLSPKPLSYTTFRAFSWIISIIHEKLPHIALDESESPSAVRPTAAASSFETCAELRWCGGLRRTRILPPTEVGEVTWSRLAPAWLSNTESHSPTFCKAKKSRELMPGPDVDLAIYQLVGPLVFADSPGCTAWLPQIALALSKTYSRRSAARPPHQHKFSSAARRQSAVRRPRLNAFLERHVG